MTILTLLERVRQERQELIEFRRGDLTLEAQAVRVERRAANTPREADSAAGAQVESGCVVLGAVDLDIAVGDRFNDDSGELYEVISVHPNRQVCAQATARLVQ